MILQSIDQNSSFSYIHRHIASIIIVLLASGLVTGCTTINPVTEGHDYEYRQSSHFVRLEPIEATALSNDHPYNVSAQTLQAWLSTLKASGNVALSGEIPVFSEQELNELTGHIVAALGRANSKQDVTFQSATNRGLFGTYSLPAYTSGRLFVRDGQLNIILGVLHERPDPDDFQADKNIYPIGSRTKRMETGWKLVSGDAQWTSERGDWASFPAIQSAVVEAPAKQADMDDSMSRESQVDLRSQKIEDKLRILNDLKAKNLITEEEYEARREVILDGI